VKRLLIDECLSQTLVAAAKSRGMEADHVVWLGKRGFQDWNLVPFAIEQNYALVTNNRQDFLREYARVALHDGLIIIVPMVSRIEQVRLFNIALDAVETLPDTVNKLVEVFADGSINVTDWPATDVNEI